MLQILLKVHADWFTSSKTVLRIERHNSLVDMQLYRCKIVGYGSHRKEKCDAGLCCTLRHSKHMGEKLGEGAY